MVTLAACGGGGGGDNGEGGGGVLIDLPNRVSFDVPTEYNNGNPLTVSFYRIYYGETSSELSPVFEVPSTGALPRESFTLTQSQKDLLLNLSDGNSTHIYAMTAVDSDNRESGFSEFIEF